MDSTDYTILEAISNLRMASPDIDRIGSLVGIDPEELTARIGLLEMQGYVKTMSKASGRKQGDIYISAVSLTDRGRRALTGERW